jgi:hypothetical protein
MTSLNKSTLDKFFNSKTDLSTKEFDFINVFIFPFICFFGMVANVISIIILFDKKMFNKARNNLIQNYMFVNSIADLMYLLVDFFLVIIRCGNLCPYGYAYASKFYELYIYLFVGYTIVTFLVLLDISVSIKKLLSFSHSNSTFVSKFPFSLMCMIFGLLALILNFPNTLSIEINVRGVIMLKKDTDNSTNLENIYGLSLKQDFKNQIVQFVLFAISLIKEPLLFVALFIINIIISFKFHRHIANKRHLCQLSKGIFLFSIKIYFTLIIY